MTSPITLALEPLKEAGLTVTVDGRYILVTDDGLEFSREHNGLAGLKQFVQDALYEYEEALAEILGVAPNSKMQEVQASLLAEEEQRARANLELAEVALEAVPAATEPKEETVYNFVEWILKTLGRPQPAADPPAREHGDLFTGLSPVEFAPAPPLKGHRLDQLALAQELNARDAMMSPKELWQAAQGNDQDRGGVPRPEDYIRDMKQDLTVAVIVKGQTFAAPKGWRIRERRPSGKVLHYASILREHKAKNQARGAEFALVRA